MRQQATLRTAVSIEGVGLHSGHPAKAHFRPAPIDHGLVFLRMDHPDRPVPARLESASTFDYATTLKHDGVSIGTVEHVLSAAAGVGLDNCLIEIEGPEVPILDGSALPFVRLFHAAGFDRQDAMVSPDRALGGGRGHPRGPQGRLRAGRPGPHDHLRDRLPAPDRRAARR